MTRRSGSDGTRSLSVRVKSARGRKTGSTRWLQRQLNDPYVVKARAEGYRSRAAFKLIELDDKFGFLKGAKRILDLGAAPGGWTQVSVERTKDAAILGLDILPIHPIPGSTLMELDFMADDAPQVIRDALGGKVDIVLSDLAPNTTGHAPTDHIRIMAMVEAAFLFACEVLNDGGTFVCKVRQGGTEQQLLAQMKKRFAKVSHAKPKASRQESAESYVVATGFTPPAA